MSNAVAVARETTPNMKAFMQARNIELTDDFETAKARIAEWEQNNPEQTKAYRSAIAQKAAATRRANREAAAASGEAPQGESFNQRVMRLTDRYVATAESVFAGNAEKKAASRKAIQYVVTLALRGGTPENVRRQLLGTLKKGVHAKQASALVAVGKGEVKAN